MLISAILSATISYHSFFKGSSLMLMSAICTNEVVTTQLTVLKIQILTVKIVSTILYNFGMLALCQVSLLFKLARFGLVPIAFMKLSSCYILLLEPWLLKYVRWPKMK